MGGAISSGHENLYNFKKITLRYKLLFVVEYSFRRKTDNISKSALLIVVKPDLWSLSDDFYEYVQKKITVVLSKSTFIRYSA